MTSELQKLTLGVMLAIFLDEHFQVVSMASQKDPRDRDFRSSKRISTLKLFRLSTYFI